MEGSVAHNHCSCQNSRVIAVSHSIKISTVHHLVLSQSTHVTDRQTDRQTDEWTDRQMDGQNCDYQDCATIDAHAVNF